ncbi:MAG: zinc ribbon domain-containing protein [Dehalococcoidia bacterium]|nr:MAG: zinc ribbon domain-containing protein [Dehalococcoidia bacterium]
MPIYDYECCSCHSRFEQRQKFEEEPLAICPECNGRARRVIHSVPVFFKGSGFYCTDNGRVLRGNHRPKEEDTGYTQEPKSEAKPDTKTEAKAGAGAGESS